MIAMPPETTADNGRSEIVLARLDRRVECHDFLRPICLPESGHIPGTAANASGISRMSNCVTMGWNVTANKGETFPEKQCCSRFNPDFNLQLPTFPFHQGFT